MLPHVCVCVFSSVQTSQHNVRPRKRGLMGVSASSLQPSSSPTMSIFDSGGSWSQSFLRKTERRIVAGKIREGRGLNRVPVPCGDIRLSKAKASGNCAILLPRVVMSSIHHGQNRNSRFTSSTGTKNRYMYRCELRFRIRPTENPKPMTPASLAEGPAPRLSSAPSIQSWNSEFRIVSSPQKWCTVRTAVTKDW